MNNSEPLLVTGASGQLGQLVLESLLAAGHASIIATTRTPEKLAAFSARGVDVRAADFNDPDGLTAAFQGASRLLLISTREIGARVSQHAHALAAARQVGVKHVVYTSYPAPETSVSAVAPDHARTEKLLRESGLGFVFLRNYLYAEVLLYTLPAYVRAGTVSSCAGDGRCAYVLREDCAAAAAGALLRAEEFAGRAFDVSGPQAYSYADLARLAGEITARPVAYADLPPEEFEATLVKAGFPKGYAPMFVTNDLAIKGGELSRVTDAVRVLTGRQPKEIRPFLEARLK